jgi:class 3 adenylate cyclase
MPGHHPLSVGSLGIEVRAGLHTGEVETIDGKAGGIAVVIRARIGGLAGPSEVQASQTVRDLTAGSRSHSDTPASTS